MLGVTTVLQTGVDPSQQKLFDLRYALPSTVASFFQIHSSQFGRPTVVRGAVPAVIKCIQCFFISVWNTSSGMGGIPPSNNTVILLCAVSFLSWSWLAHFLSPYFRANDGRISSVCDDQYTATLERLEETGDEVFKLYKTRKTQGWFLRWGCPSTPDAAAPPAPGAAPGGAGASTPALQPPPHPAPPPHPLRRPRAALGLRRRRGRLPRPRCSPWLHWGFDAGAAASPAPGAAPPPPAPPPAARPPPPPPNRPQRHWGFDAGAAAPPAPCAAAGGTGASTSARPPPPPPAPPGAALGLRRRRKTRCLCRWTTRVVRATAIRRRHLDRGDVAIRRPGVGHTPSKTSKF